MLNGSFLYSSSRTPKFISLSSCESEFHALVSCICDALFIRSCLEFLLSCRIEQVQFTDSSSARQLACRQGCGKVRHLAAKLLWVQDKVQEDVLTISQIGTTWNMADVGTKALSQRRMKLLMFEIGMVQPDGNPIGQDEAAETKQKTVAHGQISHLVKAVLRIATFFGLGPELVNGQFCSIEDEAGSALVQQELDWLKHEVRWMRFFVGIATMMMFCMCFAIWWLWKHFTREVDGDIAFERLRQDTRRDVGELRTALGNHILRYDKEVEYLEDCIEAVRFGLAERGGFMRYNSLTMALRRHMFSLEVVTL